MCVFSVDNVRNSSTGSPDRVDALVWGLTEIFDKIAGRRKQITKDSPDYTGNTTWADGSTGSYYSSGGANSWMSG